MAQFKFIPIPAEDYDAWCSANGTHGIGPDTILETYITDDGALIVRRVTGEDLEEFICDGDCDSCPVADTDCDGDCLSCPCYACCDDSDYEGACKSHGNTILSDNQTGREF